MPADDLGVVTACRAVSDHYLCSANVVVGVIEQWVATSVGVGHQAAVR